MKRLLPFAFVLLGPSAFAQSSGFGLGIMLGDPTGFCGKGWIGSDRAIDFGVAWGLVHNGYFHLHADYLFHKMDLIPVSKGRLPLYFGPGLRMRSWGSNGYYVNGESYKGSRVDIGVRFPVGLAYLFDNAPVDVFIEVVPTMGILPSTSFDFDAAVGGRYWF